MVRGITSEPSIKVSIISLPYILEIPCFDSENFDHAVRPRALAGVPDVRYDQFQWYVMSRHLPHLVS
jgi:hypothetical protein